MTLWPFFEQKTKVTYDKVEAKAFDEVPILDDETSMKKILEQENTFSLLMIPTLTDGHQIARNNVFFSSKCVNNMT